MAFVLAMLADDLGVFHQKAHEVSLKEAGIWSAVWVALALAFNARMYFWFGSDRALEFTAGYPGNKDEMLPAMCQFVHEQDPKYSCVVKVEQSYASAAHEK